ncbi:MAG: GTPase HflX [Desulfovibrio sp.]|nr:GTPase HflX [Desulfovibrio sp.]MCA1986146.1 GTPase HflX [Desulfovibrio sp.]
MGRQLGLLIDRQGRPQMVIVGGPGSIYIPELPRARLGAGRLRGLRLLHTHLTSDLLSREDLMDMLFLRLDSLAVLTVDEHGDPRRLQYANLLPVAPIPHDEEEESQAERPAYQVHDVLPWDHVDVDFAELAQALEDEWARLAPTPSESRRPAATPTAGSSEAARAVLVSISTAPKSTQERELDELEALAETAGVVPAGRMVQRVHSLNSASILSKEKLAELETLALQAGAGLVLFAGDLSPSQLTHLADATERKVLDRTMLILDIFAQHATSRAGKLQVELAQLRYTLPRLVGKNKALSRLAGGIGGRGPGEQKLEMDRRKIRERETRLKKQLEELRRHRAAARRRRARAGVPVAALVGYTNAGKSTLLNVLTQASVLAENKLFATLDPTTRRLRVPEERELILTDTVGFIRHLPEELKEAFRATLEELESADLLLHVADASHPELDVHNQAVEDILREMQLQDVPRLLVLNKWDLVDEESRAALRFRFPDAVPIAARAGQGLEELSREIVRRIDWERDVRVPPPPPAAKTLPDQESIFPQD